MLSMRFVPVRINGLIVFRLQLLRRQSFISRPKLDGKYPLKTQRGGYLAACVIRLRRIVLIYKRTSNVDF